jgi:serine/threonine protein kinase
MSLKVPVPVLEVRAMPLDLAQVEAVFNGAMNKPTVAERAAYLDEACADDADLRQRVEALLASHDASVSFLALPDPVGATHADTPLSERPGTRIGRYKLLQQIGEGGFGVVFMAEQEHPVRRTVALKVIKLGMDTKQVIARFEAERQALALMDHPNIAKVLDGGSTESGRPYFVMELVRGTPLNEYCDKHQLDTRSRLILFAQVCQAVQHAHAKGIIHRDLKPTNVLVTLNDSGKPVPKVIDFGIAKAVSQRLTEKTLFTEFRQLIGTPQYMSPEQAHCGELDVDTRSDVYTLGVLLYELLTGSTPLDGQELRSKAFAEMQRMIRETEPPAPSTRLNTLAVPTLSSVAASRSIEPGKLGRLVRGELDWIVMKALEKERDRRYQTPSGLARDIERYLADEAIEACPPSALYRLRKLGRRYRMPLRVAAAFMLLLFAATVVSTWQAIRATAEKNRADEQTAIAQAVNDFFNQDVLGQASPNNQATPQTAPERDLKVRDALDRAAERIAGRFVNQPLVEAAIRHTVGESYLDLGQLQKAERQLNEALRLRRKGLGDNHPDTTKTMSKLGHVYRAQSRIDEAEAMYQNALKGRRKAHGERDASTLDAMVSLATIYSVRGKYGEAEKLCLRVLQVNREEHREQHDSTLYAMNALSGVYGLLGQNEKAERILLDLIDLTREVKGAQHPTMFINMENLVSVYQEQGRPAEAEKACRKLLDNFSSIYGSSDPRTLRALVRLAEIKAQQGQLSEAEDFLLRAEEERRKLPPELKGGELANTIADAYSDIGNYDKAKPILQEVLDAHSHTLDPHHPQTLVASVRLLRVKLSQGQLSEAEVSLAEAEGEWHKLPPEQKEPQLAALIADTYGRMMRQHAKAEPIALELVELQRQASGPHSPVTLAALSGLADFYRENGQLDKAEQRFREVLEDVPRVLGEQHEVTITTKYRLGMLYRDQKKAREAEPLLREAFEVRQKRLGRLNPDTIEVQINLGSVYGALGQYDAAQSTLRAAIDAQREAGRERDQMTFGARHNLGVTYVGQQQFAEAERVLASCLADARDVLGDSHATTLMTASTLAGMYGDWSKRELATTSDPEHRHVQLAVELAQKAVDLSPKNANFQKTLGVARYRSGDFKGAAAALERAMELRSKGGSDTDYFFLAMAQHQLGDAKAARDSYDKGAKSMDQNASQSEYLRRLHAEAGALLGTESRASLKTR